MGLTIVARSDEPLEGGAYQLESFGRDDVAAALAVINKQRRIQGEIKRFRAADRIPRDERTIVRFVDTNVLLYAISRDADETAKSTAANAILEAGDVGLSVQALRIENPFR